MGTTNNDLLYFCSNIACALHIPHRAGKNWAELPDGRLFSRAKDANGHYRCDACLFDPENPVAFAKTEN